MQACYWAMQPCAVKGRQNKMQLNKVGPPGVGTAATWHKHTQIDARRLDVAFRRWRFFTEFRQSRSLKLETASRPVKSRWRSFVFRRRKTTFRTRDECRDRAAAALATPDQRFYERSGSDTSLG
ncbi:unnamed protein product [Ixodes persulcatus]